MILRDSAINLLGNTFRISTSLISTLLAWRWLGAEQFGSAILIVCCGMPLHSLLTLGFDRSLIFLVAKENEKKRELLSLALLSSALASLAMTIASWFFLETLFNTFGRQNSFWPAFLFAAQCGVWALGSILANYARACGDNVPLILKEQFYFPLANLVGLVVFVNFAHLSLLGFVLAYTFATLFSVVLTSIRASRDRPSHLPSSGLAIKDLKFSLPLAFLSVLETFLVNLPTVVAGWWLSLAEVGILGMLIRITYYSQLAMLVVFPLVLPTLARHILDRELQSFRSLHKALTEVCFHSAAVFVLVLITAKSFILDLLGVHVVVSDLDLFIICGAFVAEATLGQSRHILVSIGRIWFPTSASLFVLLLAILSGVSLIPWLEMRGAALTLFITYFTTGTLMTHRLHMEYDIEIPLTRWCLWSFGLLLTGLTVRALSFSPWAEFLTIGAVGSLWYVLAASKSTRRLFLARNNSVGAVF